MSKKQEEFSDSDITDSNIKMDSITNQIYQNQQKKRK